MSLGNIEKLCNRNQVRSDYIHGVFGQSVAIQLSGRHMYYNSLAWTIFVFRLSGLGRLIGAYQIECQAHECKKTSAQVAKLFRLRPQ